MALRWSIDRKYRFKFVNTRDVSDLLSKKKRVGYKGNKYRCSMIVCFSFDCRSSRRAKKKKPTDFIGIILNL